MSRFKNIRSKRSKRSKRFERSKRSLLSKKNKQRRYRASQSSGPSQPSQPSEDAADAVNVNNYIMLLDEIFKLENCIILMKEELNNPSIDETHKKKNIELIQQNEAVLLLKYEKLRLPKQQLNKLATQSAIEEIKRRLRRSGITKMINQKEPEDVLDDLWTDPKH